MTPNPPNAGPEARTSSGSPPDVPAPPTTKPAISWLAPVPTRARQEMFTSRPGFAVAVTVRVAAPLVAEPAEVVARHV